MDRQERILVVDDERGIRFLLSDVLSSQGFQVSMAKDGQESLDQLEANSFDLVITDIDMPRLDGMEMLKVMEKSGRKEKVIVMTGNPTDQRFRDAADMPHVIKILQKPFRMDSFLEVVIAAMANENDMAKRANGALAR